MISLVFAILLLFNIGLCADSDVRVNPRADNYICLVTAANQMTVQQDAYNIAAEHNGDDQNVANYAASFSKTLQHDGITGVLTSVGQVNYVQLLTALSTGLQEDFNAIVRAPEATRKFVNPQAAFTHSLVGAPCSIIPMLSAPQLTSAQAAADMIEVYLKAICRDVKFSDYGTGTGTDEDIFNGGSITANAAAVLTALGSAYKGPSIAGVVTPDVLFRGVAEGDLVGPYISQFWYLPTHKHFQLEEKQYVPIAQAREFGIGWDDFVAIQDGAVPAPYESSDFDGERYIIDARDGATVVHSDAPGGFFFNAINILLYNGFPMATNFPYNDGDITNEDPFVTMMITDVSTALFTASQEGLKHAWAHKWLANRRLRPEAMAGLVHRAKVTDTNPYNLHSTLFSELAGIDVLAWIKDHNEAHAFLDNPADAETYLLPLVYPEGSPTHPSYPAGHAVLAGACATVLKAFFDDTALITTYIAPVKPNPVDSAALVELSDPEGALLLTVGGELNKLASNIAISRNHAGVHYRADGDDGIALGEVVALKILQDWAHVYSEQGFTGFELTQFNGQRVRVTQDGVQNI